ncbi:hypothetical protein BDW60DRAFT_192506 [Aspergillus nidulans var. acristatus]
MSKNPPVSAPSPTGAHSRESRGSLERKRRHANDEFSPTTECRDAVRPRPLSWHPSAPVEPPLQPSQHRPIGVSSILNQPATEAPDIRTTTGDSGHEGLGERLSVDPPSHSRFPSSSSIHLPSPSINPANSTVLSPGIRNHQGISPVSPSARFVGAAGYFPVKSGLGQPPLAQQLPRLHTVAPSSPLPMMDTSNPPLVSGHHHQASANSTSTYTNHRASTNHTPTPGSKEASPTTPASVLSQIGRSSPAISATTAPHSAPVYMNTPMYTAVDPITRLPIVPASQRASGIEAPPGMIPCYVDHKPGSSTQAEKRKANSNASRRFRDRKRNEMQMEQRITAQQDEIRKLTETVQKQADELRVAVEQRDFYRSERDYFRDQASRFAQIPARPTSPQLLRPASEATGGSDDKAEETTTESSSHQRTPGLIAPAPMSGADWSGPLSSYPSGPTAPQTRPMASTPAAWDRTT